MVTYLLFILGFPCLIMGADLLVKGASQLARRLGVSALVIGLTVVAFGTSAPELTVNLYASVDGSTDIAIGNILGSNIANVFLILGIAAIMVPLVITADMVWKQIPLSLLAVAILGITANDVFLDDAAQSEISRIDGLVLLSFFGLFLYYIFGLARSQRQSTLRTEIAGPFRPWWRYLLYITLGLAGLIIGAKWIVDGAIKIADEAGMSERFIGLTIVAIGTSLPELATSAVAAWRRNVDIAVGNVIGSNIFNIFLVLGLSATIRPLPFRGNGINIDVGVTAATSVLLFLFMFTGKGRHLLDRREGIVFVLSYIGYIIYLILRE